jgi:hypothetical protein
MKETFENCKYSFDNKEKIIFDYVCGCKNKDIINSRIYDLENDKAILYPDKKDKEINRKITLSVNAHFHLATLEEMIKDKILLACKHCKYHKEK